MKTVIRIEHPSDGNGIWRAGGIDAIIYKHSQYQEIENRHVLSNGFPTPYRDDELRLKLNRNNAVIGEYKFAFHSLSQLKKAFTSEELKELFSLGFKVLKIKTDEFIESSYQVIFKQDSINDVIDISGTLEEVTETISW